jgi:hypothetical protein
MSVLIGSPSIIARRRPRAPGENVMRIFRQVLAPALLTLTASAQLPSPLFAPDVDVPVEAVPLATGDFDGDGDPDLVAATGVLLNDGSGRFMYGPATALFTDMVVAAVGDFDGDGLPDVVFRKATTGSAFHFARNLGGGAFASVTVAAPSTTEIAYEIRASDLDADGLAELLINTENPSLYVPATPTYWRSNGPFSFVDQSATLPPLVSFSATGGPAGPARFLPPTDMDADGDLDVVTVTVALQGSSVRTLFNAAGALTAGPVTFLGGGHTAALGDFDGDGDLDLVSRVVFIMGSHFLVSLNLGGGVFGTPASSGGAYLTPWLAAIDVDGDGVAEVVGRSPAGIDVLDVTTSGVQSSLPLQTLVRGSSWSPAEGTPLDLDLDGDLNLLVASPDGAIRTYRTNGSGLLEPGRKHLPDQLVGGALGVFDLDGDGPPDLVNSAWRYAVNDGYGGFTSVVPTSAGPASTPFAGPATVADFDLDGDLDVAFASAAVPPTISVGRNNGPGISATVVANTGYSGVTEIAAGDWSGDGQIDLVFATDPPAGGGPSGLFIQWQWQGLIFYPPVAPFVARRAGDVAAADVNGDGEIDFVVASQGLVGGPPVPCAVMLGVGNLGYVEVRPFGPTTTASTVAVGDIDGDGDTDALLDGAVFFQTATSVVAGPVYAGPALPAKHRLFDLDGDGDLDLLWGDRWLRNTGAGAFVAELIPGADASSFPRPDLQVADLDRDGDLDLVDSRLRVFFNRRRHVALGAPARLGRTATIEGFGAALAPFDLIASLQRAPSPIALPPLGYLLIDPGSPFFTVRTTLDAAGRCSILIAVPTIPALIGFTVAMQGFLFAEARLTNLIEPSVVGF